MQKSNLLSLDSAIEKIRSNFEIVSSEDVFLQNALGRCLSEPVISKINNPRFNVSSMDGYAVNYNDYINLKNKNNGKSEEFIQLNVIGEASAGKPFIKEIKSSETVRIFTGAKLPKGSNTVIIQEDIKKSDVKNYISTNIDLKIYQNIRKKGLDFKKDECLYNTGTILKSRHLGSIAMTGQAWVNVSRKPIISILSTGNEISKVGEQFKKNQIPNGNSLMIASMVSDFGGIPRILPVANDNILDIYKILNNALDSDLIVTTGGVSVGKYDLIHKALSRFKSKIEFWKIAMRPGKPLLFSKINKTPLIGLPGNPVSSGVCSMIFVNIAIKKMIGDTKKFPIYENATLSGKLLLNDQRMDFVRAKIKNKDGNVYVNPIDKQDSSMITQFSNSDCLIVRNPFDDAKFDGDLVNILKFPSNI